MKKGIFLNMVALYPVAEIHSAQRKHFDENSVVYKCDGSLKYCHVNPFGRKSICNYCIDRADAVIKSIDVKVPVVEINNKINKITISNKNIERIENSVMSSIASITRLSDRYELDKTWEEVYRNLLESSKLIFTFFEKQFSKDLDILYIFNGRFAWDGAARSAAVFRQKKYVVYDLKKSTSYYEFNNISLHSVDENNRRAMLFYIQNFKNARITAEEFINSKINGIPTYEKSFTELQQKNKITVNINLKKDLISIFPSSDDEYKFLSGEWGAPVIESQVSEIWNLVKNLDNEKYQIIIRMHPNMKGISEQKIKSYLRIGDVFKNVNVLSPEDSTSTYTLIDKSWLVVCFCSTVATEANYMRKKVINIGGSPYYKLPVANYVGSGTEAAILIEDRKIKLKPKRASIIWIYYLWKYYDKNDFISSPEEQIYLKRAAFNFEIRKSHFKRLIQSPFRAEIEIKKPSKKNLDYLKRFYNATVDILLNKFSIKL